MKDKLPYVKWFFSDWIRDTRGLSAGAKGVWIDLLSLMHDGEPYGHLAIDGVPRSDENISRTLGISLKKTRFFLKELSVNGVFSMTEKGLPFSRRMVRENHLRKVRGEGGILGGNPLLISKNSLSVTDCKDNLTSTNEDNLKDNLIANLTSRAKDNLTSTKEDNLMANLTLDTTRVQKELKTNTLEQIAKKRAPLYSDEFLKFWEIYPNKKGKGYAWTSWQKVHPPLDECLKALEYQRREYDWTKDQGQFIPHPSTWINGRHWENEPKIIERRTVSL